MVRVRLTGSKKGTHPMEMGECYALGKCPVNRVIREIRGFHFRIQV